MRKIIFLFTIIAILSFLVLPRMGLAQKPFVPPGQGVSEECQITGNCTLDEFVNFIIFRGKVLIPGIGTFALIMFVVGGIYWVISAGSPDKVERGKKIMIGAIIGIIIMFGAWLGIKVLQDMLGVEDWARPAGMKQSDVGSQRSDVGDETVGCCICQWTRDGEQLTSRPELDIAKTKCDRIKETLVRNFGSAECGWNSGSCSANRFFNVAPVGMEETESNSESGNETTEKLGCCELKGWNCYNEMSETKCNDRAFSYKGEYASHKWIEGYKCSGSRSELMICVPK